LIDCERMKYPFTGLYYYCLYLAKYLKLTNKDKNLYFYSRKETEAVLPNSVVQQHSLHKFLLPPLKRFDIWHSTYQGTMYYPWRRNIKIVLTVHDLNFMYDDSKSEAKKKKYLQQLAKKVHRADYIVAISEFVLADLKQHLPLDNKPAKVIYNGCTIEEIEKLKAPAILPLQPFLFTVGTIVDKKNFHVLPRLLKGNNYQLLIGGITNSEAYKQKIIDEANALGVADRVVFTGAISENDKQWYLKNCLAFVFPSTAEGFGLPVIEAMHFGKPVFLSRFTSLPEIGGKEAYYFERYDPDYMVSMLKNSLEHFNQNEGSVKMKERASQFSWTASAEQYHKIYDELLAM
jgi:glycosyltransferase involved in cell wall biosynthesis